MNTPKAHGIIPARYASSRLAGKPLLLLHDKPMFWHVWNRAKQCSALASVTLATDDERIATAAKELHVPFVMTKNTHQSGTDRVHEAAMLLGCAENDIIVNIQGDEPALNPQILDILLEAFTDPTVQVATLAHPLAPEDLTNPNKVKVVLAANNNALYFSRAAIPFQREEGHITPLGHIGLYAFTRNILNTFISLPASCLEQTEKLEQLRFLENSIPIRVMLTHSATRGIDSAADIAPVLRLMQQ